MGIDYSRLTPSPILFEGLGGFVRGYEETAILSFVEARRLLHSYAFVIAITEPRPRKRPPHPEDIVALLGRDLLSNWSMSYSQTNKRVQFKVLSSDFTTTIPP